MGFLNWLQEKVTGITLAEYGDLSPDTMGLKTSVTLRKRNNQKYYLVFKWEGPGQLRWEEIEATSEVLTRLETILKDVRIQIADQP